MKTMLGFAAVLVLFPLAASAQTYKCVDDRGKTFYTDKLQKGCKSQKVDQGLTSTPGRNPARAQGRAGSEGSPSADRCAQITREYNRLRQSNSEDSQKRLDAMRDDYRACR